MISIHKKPFYFLGISAFYHNGAAVLIKNGQTLFACEDERLTTIKGDAAFPVQSISFVLNEAKTKAKRSKEICG